MTALPAGTVTFLFTDIEGSTRLWESVPDAMARSLALHDETLRAAVDRNGGIVCATMGDGMAVAFPSAPAAVRAAVEVQLALHTAPWPDGTGMLKVRMGLHTDDAEVRAGQYLNTPLNRCARIMAVAHGGQVLISGATEALVRSDLPAGVTLLDLGEHRLRDLPDRVHLLQLVHPALPARFPPLRAVERVGNLPSGVTSFVGRDADIAAIHEAFERSRLVTITGPGGVGKTRMAIEAAARVAPDHPDGAWFCELASSGDADSAVQVVATTIGVAPRPGLSVEGSIVDFARTKKLLVVLDNCEQVLTAVSALADRLVRSCPDVLVLATSREELDVEGEQVVRLGALAVADAAAPLAAIAASDGVRLFVDRAVAVDRDFVLDAGNAPAIAEISRRLDGMPLALELAAARVAVLSPQQIAELLDDRFQLLTTGWRTAPERHQTLRATVDWSYSLLGPEEQQIFAGLGVFPGSFGADAVVAVGAPESDRWTVLDALTSLVAKSMVVRDDASDRTPRYRLLETLREYARDQLHDADAVTTLRRRLAVFAAEFAEQAGAALQGRDELAWRPRLRAEIDTLRASVHWALASPREDDGDLAVRIAAALAPYAVYESAGDVAALVEAAVGRARMSAPGPRAAVLGAAAFAAFQNRGDVARAEELATEALRDGLTPDCPDPGSAYGALIMALTWTGRAAEGQARFVEARAAFARIGAGDHFDAWILQTAAAVGAMTGDIDTARAHALEALRLAEGVGNPSALTAAQWAASLTMARDQPDRALELADEAIALVRAGASGAVLGHVLAIRAQLRVPGGDPTGAVADLREAVECSRDKGDRVMLVVALDRGLVVFGRLGATDAVAVLSGVVAGGGPLAAISTLPRLERDDRAALIEHARAELGPEASDAASERGAAMSVDDVVDYVLSALDRLPGGER